MTTTLSLHRDAFFRIRGAQRLLTLGVAGIAVAVVAGASIFGLMISVRPLHLSLTAEAVGEGKLLVTNVVTGGLGDNAKIRPGDVIQSFAGGKLERRSNKTVLRDPVDIEVIDRSGGIRQIRAEALYWIGRSGPPLLALLAMVYVLVGAGLYYLRPWDPTVRWTLLLFFSLGLTLSIGAFAGIWGGSATVFLEALALYSSGISLVALMQSYPRRVEPLSRIYQALRYSVSIIAFALLLLYAGRLLGLVGGLDVVLLAAPGVYLPLCLGVAIVEGIWSYQRALSPLKRLQFRIAGFSLMFGLIPTFLLLLPALVLFDHVEFVPFSIVIVSLTIVPIGWGYALLQPMLREFHRRFQWALATGALLVAGFIVAVAVTNTMVESFEAQPETMTKILPATMGFLGAALMALALSTVGVLRRSLEIGQTPLSLSQATVPKDWPGELKDLAIWAEAASGVAVSVLVNGNKQVNMHDKVVKTLTSGARRALENVVQHSLATECIVQVGIGPQKLELTIQDNGKGFEPWSPDGAPLGWGLGLRSIKENVDALGGSFGIMSSPGRGTLIHISLSLVGNPTGS